MFPFQGYKPLVLPPEAFYGMGFPPTTVLPLNATVDSANHARSSPRSTPSPTEHDTPKSKDLGFGIDRILQSSKEEADATGGRSPPPSQPLPSSSPHPVPAVPRLVPALHSAALPHPYPFPSLVHRGIHPPPAHQIEQHRNYLALYVSQQHRNPGLHPMLSHLSLSPATRLTPAGHHCPSHSSPGGSSQSSCSKRKRTWSRAVFSNLQRKGLEKRFDVQKYVTKPDRRQLASLLGLTDAQVKVWFQNRRMKWRHQKEAKKKEVQNKEKSKEDRGDKEDKDKESPKT